VETYSQQREAQLDQYIWLLHFGNRGGDLLVLYFDDNDETLSSGIFSNSFDWEDS
jgi:hypothetical protein